MPTSLFAEIERAGNAAGNGSSPGSGSGGGSSIEDQRALALAFELSMLGLENGATGAPSSAISAAPVVSSVPDSVVEALNSSPSSVFEEARSKKSQNMTECVPVPSSEHVAEIVGRQGKLCCSRLLSFFIIPIPYHHRSTLTLHAFQYSRTLFHEVRLDVTFVCVYLFEFRISYP